MRLSSLPNSSAQNAISPAKMDDCRRAGAAVVEMLKRGIKPLDIMTRKAFENSITVVIALGGSTNAVLHLLAIAHAAKVKLSLDDFTRIGKRVPVLADLKPSGKHLMSELVAIGGIRPLMKTLLDAGLLHGDALTVTGHTMAETLAGVQPYPAGQTIVQPLDQPIKLGLLKVPGNRNHCLARIVVCLYIVQQIPASQPPDRLLST